MAEKVLTYRTVNSRVFMVQDVFYSLCQCIDAEENVILRLWELPFPLPSLSFFSCLYNN